MNNTDPKKYSCIVRGLSEAKLNDVQTYRCASNNTNSYNNEMICIVCPMGCRMTVSKDGNILQIEGNQCDRGKKYATDEMTNPLRTVTSTVKISGAAITRLPVKTEKPIPKDKVFELMIELKKVEVRSPVKIGDVVLKNPANTGVNIIATKSSALHGDWNIKFSSTKVDE